MATSVGATAAAAATTSASAATATRNVLNSSKCLPLFRHHYSQSHPKLKLKLRFSSSKDLHSNWNHSVVAKAQLNKVSVDGSSNAAPGTPPEPEVSSASNDVKLSSETSPAVLASEESIAEFLSQVSTLVKLVDSRDIAELKLKQLDCELIIRKKEALQPPSAAPPPHTPPVQSHYMPAIQPSALPSSVPAPPPVPGPAQAPLPQKTKPSESSLPPLKCPMAGTFYRSPGPSEPPFVKVGDKVQKGQVLCIIEAMKLMNEIEADQSGTIVEILAEDGKPVSVDTPLFVIKP
ncbi:PREDICTED: biotin carboxyl carrier protein of acetyl-CoA carboxylase, chloroplastic [Ipomoea nil]|uniref:biotin carboxyl carrier protein of acetyl-CoA carboxylase, chloroplastic n=1 Tax=Ipomoea nil TaxID=35883 RepID=UPI000901150B|nr:PREDICTED: biotin carboxyl carrier protein of acetyl-CoA carboxylase, chloroplastic [Ipomoea nil]